MRKISMEIYQSLLKYQMDMQFVLEMYFLRITLQIILHLRKITHVKN